MKVKECMCNQVACVKPETTIKDVSKIMKDKHVGCIPVCDNNNQLVGLVTDRDLILRGIAVDKDINQTAISEVMTTKVFNISPEADVAEASKLMCECQVRRLPVIENNAIVGIITLGDLANKEDIETTEVGNTVENICDCSQNAKNNQ